MTAFEKFFDTLKKIFGIVKENSKWPNFSPIDVTDFTIVNMPNLGRVIVLNCQDCDGPSDPRHETCFYCIKKQIDIIKKQEIWNIPKYVMLSRIYNLPNIEKGEHEKDHNYVWHPSDGVVNE